MSAQGIRSPRLIAGRPAHRARAAAALPDGGLLIARESDRERAALADGEHTAAPGETSKRARNAYGH
jgi:hypothetical protein